MKRSQSRARLPAIMEAIGRSGKGYWRLQIDFPIGGYELDNVLIAEGRRDLVRGGRALADTAGLTACAHYYARECSRQNGILAHRTQERMRTIQSEIRECLLGIDRERLADDLISDESGAMLAVLENKRERTDKLFDEMAGLEKRIEEYLGLYWPIPTRSIGSEKPLEKTYVGVLVQRWRRLTGEAAPRSRSGPFVRFAQAAWRDLQFETSEQIDDALATYCGTGNIARRDFDQADDAPDFEALVAFARSTGLW